MKTFFKSLVLIAASAFTLTACSQKEILAPVANNESITLKFNIRNSDDAIISKAVLGTEDGKNFLNWENGDKIGTFSVGEFPQGENVNTTSNNNAGTVVVNGDDYTLNVQTFNAGTVTNIYSYFPHSAAAGKNKSAAIVTIPETQTMNDLGFDADAMPMAGEPVTVDITTTAANTDTPCGTIRFGNLGSIIQFKIYSSVATDETITSVTYKGTGIGGAFTIDLTAVDLSDESTLALTASDAINEITTAYTTHPSIPTGKANAIPVYMVVAPGTYSSTQIIVTTNAHTYTLDASNAKTYERSHVKPMNVDIQNGTQGDLPVAETWTKVTSAADMTAGTYYILSGDETVSLPNTEAGSAPAAQAFSGTVSNNMKWEATVSGTGLVFKNPTAELYLWGQDGTNNGVRVKQSAPAAASSKVWTFTDDADLGVLASVGSTRYLAVYNNSGTLQDWRNYQTGNSLTDITHAVFYKLDVTDTRTEVTLSFASAAIEKTTDDYDEFTGQVASASPNVSAVTSNIAYALTGDAIGTVNATSGAVTLNGTAGTATITASFAGDAAYKPATASYEITVVDANANDGSASKPYTASEAVDVASASGFTDTDNVYVKGIVCTTGSISNGAVNYYISDDGTTTKKFEAYKGKYISGADFTDATNLKLGDYVVACGTLTYFSSGSQAEFKQGSEVISVLRAPSFSPSDGDFSTATLSVTITADSGAQIRYTTDGTDPTATTGTVYSSAISIDATTTIKAIAVKDGVVTGVVSKVYSKVSSGSTTATFIFNTDAGISALGISKPAASAGTKLEGPYTVDGVTMAVTHGSTDTRIWNSSGTLDLRIYKSGGTLTFSVESGKNIKKIELAGSAVNNFSVTVGSFSSGTWTGSANSVTLTASNTGKINTIAVTYE